MSSTNIYIVAGETGEYSDTRVWYVAAFVHREDADEMCRRLNGWVRAVGLSHVRWDDPRSRKEIDSLQESFRKRFDPQFESRGAVDYSVITVPRGTLSRVPLAPAPVDCPPDPQPDMKEEEN